MKRLDLIERKLTAIRAKDANSIVAKRIHLPFMGKLGTVSGIGEWLTRRVEILEDAKQRPEPEIEEQIVKLSEGVCKKCQDALAREPLEISIPCKKDYETMCAIHLYRFSLGFYE